MSDSMAKALDLLGKKKSKLRMNLREMDDGKVYVQNSYEGGSEYKEPQESAHDQKGLHEHIDKHFFGKSLADQRSDKDALPEGGTREAYGAK